jgi:hypothetical protein
MSGFGVHNGLLYMTVDTGFRTYRKLAVSSANDAEAITGTRATPITGRASSRAAT